GRKARSAGLPGAGRDICGRKGMRRFGFVCAMLALAALSFAIGRTTRRTHVPPAGAGPALRVPGIVVVCLDTLRADALASDADGEGLAAVRAWAGGATTFTDAIAPSSWTLPSVASL